MAFQVAKERFASSDPETWQRIQQRAAQQDHPIWGLMYKLPRLSEVALSSDINEEQETHLAEKPEAQCRGPSAQISRACGLSSKSRDRCGSCRVDLEISRHLLLT